MTERGHGSPVAASTTTGLSYDGEFTVGSLHLRSTDRGIKLRNDKVGSHGVVKPKKGDKNSATRPPGFGSNGELRIGAITLALGADGDQLQLRRENVGHNTIVDSETLAELLNDVFFHDSKGGQPDENEVSEAAVEGVLEGAFFTRVITPDGSVKTNLAQVREQRG